MRLKAVALRIPSSVLGLIAVASASPLSSGEIAEYIAAGFALADRSSTVTALPDATRDVLADNRVSWLALLTSTLNVPPEATHDVLGENRANWVAILGGIRGSALSETSAADHALTATPSMPLTAAEMSGAVITLGSETVTAIVQPSGRVVVGEANLKLGQDVIVHGYTLRDRSSALEINGQQTMSFSILSMPTVLIAPHAHWQGSELLLQVGTATATLSPRPSGRLVLDGKTIMPGQDTMIAGQVVRAASSALIFGTHTLAFDSIPTTTVHSNPNQIASAASIAVLTLASTTVTAVAQASGQVQIDGNILRPGQDIVINGYTLRDVRTGVVLNGQTTAAFSTISMTPTGTGPPDAILTGGSEGLTVVPQSSARVITKSDTFWPGWDTPSS